MPCSGISRNRLRGCIIQEMSFGPRDSLGERHCSFCRKSEKTVGWLISNSSDYPRVYICAECIRVSSQILEEKEDPIVGNPLLLEFLAASEQWIAVESSGQDATKKLSNVRRIASLMFADSVQHGT